MSSPKPRKKAQYSLDELVEFGARLRHLRGKHSMGQMADKYAVSTGYWSKLESGSGGAPSLRLVELIALKEHVDLNWLMTGAGDPPDISSEDEFHMLPSRFAAVAAASQMDKAVETTFDILMDEERRKGLVAFAGEGREAQLDQLKIMVRKRMRGA